MVKINIPCKKCGRVQGKAIGNYVQVRERNGYIPKINFVLCNECLEEITNEN